MLDHPADRLRFLNHPRTIPFLQIIGDLHSRSRRCTGFGPEYNLGARLIPTDGNASDIHFNGAHIESTEAVEVLHDAGANGVVVAVLLLAAATKQKCGGEPQRRGDTSHTRVLSISLEPACGNMSFNWISYSLQPAK